MYAREQSRAQSSTSSQLQRGGKSGAAQAVVNKKIRKGNRSGSRGCFDEMKRGFTNYLSFDNLKDKITPALKAEFRNIVLTDTFKSSLIQLMKDGNYSKFAERVFTQIMLQQKDSAVADGSGANMTSEEKRIVKDFILKAAIVVLKRYKGKDSGQRT